MKTKNPKTRKVEFLVAFEEGYWNTKILDVPISIRGKKIVEWAEKPLDKMFSGTISLVAVYCDPAQTE